MANRNRCGQQVPPAGSVDEAYHGAIDHSEMRRRGIDPDQLIDFSTNINPFGPSPRVRQAVCDCVLDRYPDRECLRLRETISAHESISLQRIVVGNGSSELLQSLAAILLQPGDEALVLGPTYGEYIRAARLAGARVEECRATAESDFAIPAGAFLEALRSRQPKVAFICNPNNPTGQAIEHQQILDWVRFHRGTCFIVDESYIDFADSMVSAATADCPNLVVLKSLTKSYALAGLRLGYTIADPGLIQRLCQRRVPWSVSAPAQAAGVAAIEDQPYLNDCLGRLRVAKHELMQGLGVRQMQCVASAANFFLLSVGDAASVRQQLLSDHLLVRDGTSFGLPRHIRIGIRSSAENAELLKRLHAGPHSN